MLIVGTALTTNILFNAHQEYTYGSENPRNLREVAGWLSLAKDSYVALREGRFVTSVLTLYPLITPEGVMTVAKTVHEAVCARTSEGCYITAFQEEITAETLFSWMLAHLNNAHPAIS